LRINEILINNIDNYTDDYGKKVPWVEIFNTAYNSVNIAECYLTNDTTGLSSKNPKDKAHWYRIPKGDPKTLIPARGFLIFFLDNNPTHGPFHTNFDPRDNSSNNYVALIHSNGLEILDFFSYPASLRYADKSYGYRENYGTKTIVRDGVEVPNLGMLDHFTPGSTNIYENQSTKAEIVEKKDRFGIGMAVISMSVVFIALFLIFLILKGFGKWVTKVKLGFIIHGHNHSKPAAVQNIPPLPIDKKNKRVRIDNSEELAAMTMALHLYLNEYRDEESEIITIDMPSARYSPWAQKELVMKRVQRRW
jgi:Na+-transporting methylmalonyl-CoA/oxaloacetate decarboxylase gamma subunit